ncbi:MAG TPA: aldo/keto reductase [Myxococcota bacterium]
MVTHTAGKTRTLVAGVEIPLLGFGTYLIPDAEADAAVSAAIDAGYRHIDTAELYQNEEGVGRALKASLPKHGLTRDDIFITTKISPGNPAWGQTPRTTATTIAQLDNSLHKLGLDHVDLYLIHATFQKEARIAQWAGMVELLKQGKAKAVGVSNFNGSHIDDLVEAGLPLPHANQIELHPWSQKPELVRYLDDKGIVPIAYSSLVPLSTWRTGNGDTGKSEQMKKESGADGVFAVMAKKYGVSESRLLLRWAVQLGWPVLPKSTKPERIKDNADLFSFVIDDADMKAIATMDKGRGVAWGTQPDPVTNA